MKNESKERENGFPLTEKSTIFFIPFYQNAKQRLDVLDSAQSLWVKEEDVLTDEHEGNVIYPHIMSFLQGQMMLPSTEHHSSLQIYSIANSNRQSGNQRTIIKKFWNKFAQSSHSVEVGDPKSPRSLSFRFIQGTNSLLNPHLFIYPTAGIGILSFAVTLTTENATSKDLKLMNYHLRKLFHPLAKCVCHDLSLRGNEKPEVLEAKTNAFNQARTYIGEHTIPRKKRGEEKDNEPLEFSWDMLSLCHTLLKDVQGSITLFSPSRAHIFTFATIDDSNTNTYTNNDVMEELYSLARGVNDKYMLSESKINPATDILQTFENVQLSTCVEGTAFVAIMKPDNKEFFRLFRNTISIRYFWIYLLAMLQRYSLLNMDRILTDLSFSETYEPDSAQRHNELLWYYLGAIQEVKVRCHFTDISPFTQHNEFYHFCCDKLHVNIAYDEIDKKTKTLNLTISHDMQLLHEEEVRQQEKRDHNLNLFLGILAALQAIGIIYDFAYALLFDHDYRSSALYLGLIVLAVIMVIWLYAAKKKK